MKHDRRQDILKAAMELFAKKGFRGTTTRDLATQADVNEAIIFRHFLNKEELYSAILEHKAGDNRDAHFEELERLASGSDDETFFHTVGRTFLQKHESDTTFLRLLLFSALEGHQLSDMFVASMTSPGRTGADEPPGMQALSLRPPRIPPAISSSVANGVPSFTS